MSFKTEIERLILDNKSRRKDIIDHLSMASMALGRMVENDRKMELLVKSLQPNTGEALTDAAIAMLLKEQELAKTKEEKEENKRRQRVSTMFETTVIDVDTMLPFKGPDLATIKKIT